MPSSTSAASSPRSPILANSPESTPRAPVASAAATLRRATLFPDGFLRGLDAPPAPPPRGLPRPASAGARLPTPAAHGNRVVRQLDLSDVPVSPAGTPPVGRVVIGRHRPNLTLNLSLLDESFGAPMSPAGSVGEPVWTTSPDFSRPDSSSGTSTSATEASRNPSTGTSPAPTLRLHLGEPVFDATQIYVHARHDEARHLIDSRGQDAVHALLCVVTELLTRTEAPTPPSGGLHSPLWKDKVDNLDPVFLDKLPALALARRLKNIYQDATSGIALFDPTSAASASTENPQAVRFGKIQALTGELLESMMSETPPNLLARLGGDKRARLGFLKIIADNIERGLETRDFPKDEPRYAAIAKLVQEASYDLRDLAEPAASSQNSPEDARRKTRTALTQRVVAALP